MADADITRHASGHERPPHGAGDCQGPLGPESADQGDAQQADERLVAETTTSDEHDPRQDGKTEKITQHSPRQVAVAEDDIEPARRDDRGRSRDELRPIETSAGARQHHEPIVACGLERAPTSEFALWIASEFWRLVR